MFADQRASRAAAHWAGSRTPRFSSHPSFTKNATSSAERGGGKLVVAICPSISVLDTAPFPNAKLPRGCVYIEYTSYMHNTVNSGTVEVQHWKAAELRIQSDPAQCPECTHFPPYTPFGAPQLGCESAFHTVWGGGWVVQRAGRSQLDMMTQGIRPYALCHAKIVRA